MKREVIFSIFILFVFLSFSLASVNLVGENLKTNYSEGDLVSGKIFLNLNNQPASSLITSNFAGNKTLIQLLTAQSNLTKGVHYNCTTSDCGSTYVSQGKTTGFLLNNNDEKYAGFVISGTGVSVSDAEFSVQSNAGASCNPQVRIDVLDDGIDLLTNSKTDGQSCGQRYNGCYNQNNNIETTITKGIEYCEKLSMPASSGFIVGGEIRNGTSNANLTMKLYDYTEGKIAGTCILPKHTQTFQELSCNINYTAPVARDYFVCIRTSNNGGFKIGWETTGNNCGTAQGLFESLTSDFDLFAEKARYSASPNFVVNGTNYGNQFSTNLASVIDEYISNKYNRECQPAPCIVPISFEGTNQFIQLSGGNIEYNTVGVPASIQGLNEIDSADSLVNGNNLSIDISKANFAIPIGSNEDKLKIFIDEDEIVKKSITLKKRFLFDIEPKFVAFGQMAQFFIITDKNITSSSWNFGDGTPLQNSSGKQAVHRYTQNNVSVFQISVTAKENTGLESTRLFSISVGNPKDLVNVTIKDYKLRVENLTNQINTYPSWAIQKIQTIVKLQDLTSGINAAENSVKSAVTEDDFKKIMSNLIALKMPKSISAVKSANNLPLAVSFESINPNYIERIDNNDVPDNSGLAEGIVAWMNEKFSAEITFKNLALVRDFDSEVVASLFSIETKPVEDFDDKTYLIFGQDIENSGFYKPGYQIKSIGSINVDYALISPKNNEVYEFLIWGDLSPENLGAYISPSIKHLNVEDVPDKTCKIDDICSDNEDVDSCPEDCSSRWIKFFVIGWIILAITFIVAYIILQEWYKKNYQKKLFPDENDLYNLINFIYNARRAKLNDEQVKIKLKYQGWTSERINFAFKKIEGKRMGMLEIPLFTHIQHRQTIAKLSAKQDAPVDARFIKRPSFN
jgi:hypothetical protein